MAAIKETYALAPWAGPAGGEALPHIAVSPAPTFACGWDCLSATADGRKASKERQVFGSQKTLGLAKRQMSGFRFS